MNDLLHVKRPGRFFDKRLEGDTHEKVFVVMLINGDTDTHYVNPVKSIAVCDDEDAAKRELDYLLNHLKKFVKDGTKIITESREDEDRYSVRVEGKFFGEWLITIQKVVKNGTLNLSSFRIF